MAEPNYGQQIDAGARVLREWANNQPPGYLLPDRPDSLPPDCPLWRAGLNVTQAQGVLTMVRRERLGTAPPMLIMPRRTETLGPQGINMVTDRSKEIEHLRAGGATVLSVKIPEAKFERLYRIHHYDEKGVWGTLLEETHDA